jgi:hypothetical protein
MLDKQNTEKIERVKKEERAIIFKELEKHMEVISGFWNVIRITMLDDEWESLKSGGKCNKDIATHCTK